jgi:hypothetical protein
MPGGVGGARASLASTRFAGGPSEDASDVENIAHLGEIERSA